MAVDRKGSDIGFAVTKRGPPNASGDTGAPPAVDGTLIAFPNLFVPPPNGDYFTLQAEVDTAIQQNVVFASPVFVVPDAHDAVINTIQFFASNADATLAALSFRVLIGGNPKVGFEALTIPQLGGAQGVNISPAFVRVGPGLAIGAGFINGVGAGAHHVGMFIQGWFWPRGV